VIVRAATFDDVPQMVALGRQGHAKSDMARFAFDATGAKFMAGVCIRNDDHCAFVAEHAGDIVGLVLGMAQEYDYMKAQYATDILVYSARPGSGALLMRRFIKWALDERKVDRVMLGETYGGRSSSKAEGWYAQLGARR
jgi:hypothetical protein